MTGPLLPPARRPQIALAVVALTYLSCVAGTVPTFHPRTSDVITFVAVVVCGLVSVEASIRLGWPVRQRTERLVRGLLAAWTFPIVLLLPPMYALAIAVPLFVYTGLRAPRVGVVGRGFAALTSGLAGMAAAGAHQLVAGPPSAADLDRLVGEWTGLVGIVLAAAVALTVTIGASVLMAILVAPERSPLRQLGGRGGIAVEVGELSLGVLVAVAWAASPLLILLALLPEVLVQRTLLHSELQRAARTDAKTGLANHAYWRDVAERELARSRTGQQSLAVLIVDIDHFKSVNDRYGHLAGDDVITAVASSLAAGLRPRDLVGRFGGEEFAVLLAGSDMAQAHSTAERCRERVEMLSCPVGHGDGQIQVTVSIGVAQYPGSGHSLHDLLDAADQAMYAAKEAGRNCVRDAGEVEQTVLDLTQFDVLDLTTSGVHQAAMPE